MVLKCCVPKCNGNYTSENKVHVFKFPKDDVLKQKWLRSIPRQDFKVTNYSVVCHRHFKATDIIWEVSATDGKTGKTITAPLSKPRLDSNAVPCIFPNCPAYLSSAAGPSREAPEEKRRKLEAAALEESIKISVASHNEYLQRISFNSLQELESKVNQIPLQKNWVTIVKEQCILFMYIDLSVQPHYIVYIVIDSLLKVEVYSKGVSVNLQLKNVNRNKVTNINDLSSIIHQCDSYIERDKSKRSPEEEMKSLILGLIEQLPVQDKSLIGFLKSQLSLSLQQKNSRVYDTNYIIFCSILLLISPHAYNFVRSRSQLIFPHPNTLKTVCSTLNCSPIVEQNSSNFLQYIKDKVNSFQDYERHVSLMVDEIYIKPYMDYKGGNIVGASSGETALATSAHVFMIQSVLSAKKEVVHILPVNTLTAADLFKVINRVILGLHAIGLTVLAVVTDNNAVNSKAMSFFATPPELKTQYCHPSSNEKPLFYIFDSVHLFKSIRNNWLNQKNEGLDYVYPNFNDSSLIQTASFKTLRAVFELERNEIVKHGYGLSVKALWPTSFERQNVQYVCKIFSDHVANSLVMLSDQHHLRYGKETAEFLQIIISWWNVMNVKTPCKGIRLNNRLQQPLTNETLDERKMFLNDFLVWLEHWKNINAGTGKLSPQTFTALRHTTQGILQLADYCIKEMNYDYLLPGKFQTDVLESRFGQYRQLAGGQYHISVRQVFEIEKKIRLLSSIELPLDRSRRIVVKDVTDDTSILDHNYCITKPTVTFSEEFKVTQKDLDDATPSIALLTYIAGYCCHSLLKRLKCGACKQFLLRDDVSIPELDCVIENLSRGSLKYPTETPVLLVTYVYIVIRKMLKPENERIFLGLINQRKYITQFVLEVVLVTENCVNGTDCDVHTSVFLCKNIIWKCVNVLLNNYCKFKNAPDSQNSSNPRKSRIFSKT